MVRFLLKVGSVSAAINHSAQSAAVIDLRS